MTEVQASETTASPPLDRLAGVRRRPSGELPPLPKHFSTTTLRILAISGVVTIVWFVIGLDPTLSSWVSLREDELVVNVAAHRTAGLSSFIGSLYSLLYTWLVPVIGWSTIILLIVYQRWRHLLVFFASLLVTIAAVVILQGAITRPRPYGVEILGRWEDWPTPSRPIAMAAAMLSASALALVPRGRLYRILPFVLVALLAVYACMETYLGVSYPTDQLLAALIGGTLPLVIFRLFAPQDVFPVTYRRGNTAHLDITGARGEAIRRAVQEQLGLTVLDVKPIGLEGSAGSTPLRLKVADAATGAAHAPLFAKLLARSHLRSDRFYKLFRTLRYGRLEDENKFGTVRRLVSQEDYLALRMAAAGIKVPTSLGIIEITPEREYMVVTEFLDGFVEIGDAEQVSVALIDNALTTVRRMWDAGLAHRDVKPSNVMVCGDEVALIDVAFGQVRPSPWRQAVDLANMMLVLALRSDAELVYQRACLQFTTDDIAEAFAASRGITLPSQVRHQVKKDGRDLLAIFRGLGPSRPKIKIQRWSWRRVGLTVWVVVAGSFFVLLSFAYLTAAGMLP